MDIASTMYIDGQWRGASDGRQDRVINPATERTLVSVPHASAEDVDAAVTAARAQADDGPWQQIPGVERGIILSRVADLIERDADKLAHLEALDVGKPVTEPRLVDIPQAAATFRHFAGWADKIGGRVIPTSGYQGRPTHSYTRREPVGVVAAILPWNAPTMISSWKIAPALAVGNSLVVKPSEEAPLAVLHLTALLEESGVPKGVVNTITGAGDAGASLSQHPGVDKVSFTGSPEVGRSVMRAAAETFKRFTLELGGKSPHIVYPDADLQRAIPQLALGMFANQGQICAAGSRILVHRSLFDWVVEELTHAASNVRVGDPLADDTEMGTLINRTQLERVLRYIDIGKEHGANLVTGGERIGSTGYFVQPTIFTGDNDMPIAREEIFGPVGVVIPFESDEDAVRIANDTKYGLAATLWTQDISRAHDQASRLKAGAVHVNGWSAIDPSLPWGGFKTSGIGRELGWSGIESNTEEKVITIVL